MTMPGGDRTGPAGAGARTGRGAGFCSGSGQPGWKSTGYSSGRCVPGGGGRGWRNRCVDEGRPRFGRARFSEANTNNEIANQVAALRDQLGVLERRLDVDDGGAS